MKVVLFLDDDTRRTDEFTSRMRDMPCTLVTVATARECIERLAERSYDLVLLDHDLEGETYCDSSRDDCGMEVVRWLKANRGEHGRFIVHTMNAVAAAAMYFELGGVGYTVHQAVFGSPEFYAAVYQALGVNKPAARRPGLGERVSRYFKGLRGRS